MMASCVYIFFIVINICVVENTQKEKRKLYHL